jgi:hypothetical protein
MRIIDLAGTPEEIGFGHGRALADEIAAHLDRWRAHLSASGVDDPIAFADDLVGNSGFVDTAAELLPDLADEVAALADGAGIRPSDAWLLQLMDETWAILRPPVAGLGCTTFGVVTGARTWSGQTMDLERFRLGAQAVLRILPAAAPEQIVVTMAGCLGLLGVSHAGFAVLVNALPQVPAGPDGVPVTLLLRAALAAASADAAAEVVRGARHATGQHYLIAGSERVVSLECSPAGIAQVMPGSFRQWHTNHPLVGYLPEPADAESEARWQAVQPVMRLPGWGRRRTREVLELPLVCRLAGDVVTFAACTVEQSSGGIEVWVTDGAPHPDAWQLVEW